MVLCAALPLVLWEHPSRDIKANLCNKLKMQVPQTIKQLLLLAPMKPITFTGLSLVRLHHQTSSKEMLFEFDNRNVLSLSCKISKMLTCNENYKVTSVSAITNLECWSRFDSDMRSTFILNNEWSTGFHMLSFLYQMICISVCLQAT